MRILPTVLVLALGVALTACADPTGPAEGLSFEVTEVGEKAAGEAGIEVTVEDDELVVVGALSAPNPCHTLSARLEGDRVELVLRIEARPQRPDGGCFAILGGFEYRAVVTGLPASAQRLRVVHSYRGSDWETESVRVRLVRSS